MSIPIGHSDIHADQYADCYDDADRNSEPYFYPDGHTYTDADASFKIMCGF